MSIEYHGEFVKTPRVRCDVCKRLIPRGTMAKGVVDAVAGQSLDLCSWRCGDVYFSRYQLPLASPCGNTGVLLAKNRADETEEYGDGQ